MGVIKYIDNGYICGWYFVIENNYFGDGTKENAEQLARKFKDELLL